MILTGKLPVAARRPRRVGPREVVVDIKIETEDFTRYVVKAARQITTLDITLEVLRLTPDQAWALFYTRGGFDPEFADPVARDNYLRSVLCLKGERGRAAIEGFLTGWAKHHDTPVDSFVWHRYMSGAQVCVSADSARGVSFHERCAA